MLKRFLVTFSITASIIIVFSLIITQKREERRTIESRQKLLAEKVDRLRDENERLRKENDALVNDPVQIEREARDNYGYTKPGEITYERLKFNITVPENNETRKTPESGGLESFLFEGPFPWQIPSALILIATIFLLISYKYER